ncbi:hypothetical protein Rhe02_86300 [Rhizocola hellebori]|uniref:Uncharacterized protein n=1 Tax=Rhizocola hellebori TaxID=1392758 RepID=A0A8J3QGS0_9ACTN|nr:hypothetical protein [Rhizocola hellebori]GIH10563.1 hypothetical protein Rhe02_86300 [Rhizocola hellebori]
MGTYTERATLHLIDGSRPGGAASLRSKQVRGLWSWEGTFLPDDQHANFFGSQGQNILIELPGGQTGEVLLQNVQIGSHVATNIRLLGSGPPPF